MDDHEIEAKPLGAEPVFLPRSSENARCKVTSANSPEIPAYERQLTIIDATERLRTLGVELAELHQVFYDEAHPPLDNDLIPLRRSALLFFSNWLQHTLILTIMTGMTFINVYEVSTLLLGRPQCSHSWGPQFGPT